MTRARIDKVTLIGANMKNEKWKNVGNIALKMLFLTSLPFPTRWNMTSLVANLPRDWYVVQYTFERLSCFQSCQYVAQSKHRLMSIVVTTLRTYTVTV